MYDLPPPNLVDQRDAVEQTELPLTEWFLAIHLLTQAKTSWSALALKRDIGVSYNTAWSLKRKIMQAMKERDDRNPLTGINGTYHAIQPKHLPRYLAEFCYRFNRRFDLQAMMP